MKKFAVLVLVLMSVLLIAVPAQAQKPLWGEMDLQFNHACWTAPSIEIPDWIGTIMLDDSGPYTIVFYNTGSGKRFSLPFKGPEFPDHTVVFFGEIWAIYDWATFDCGTEQLDFGALLLSGTDTGSSATANGKFQANGTVSDAAGEFAMWLGRNMHMSGVIIPGITGLTVTDGVFRLN